ncbi:Uncharacterized conserved protein, DUF2141 family [Nitrosomonas cryotolerans]|uniref:Uncharacterized conserved protein, DUF2141 family n=1 Tax=Nitrosomonas cryotolerans ATCC 49181 TaxID=1131553 RepID=A0A1N6IQQ6_9PROT|nr:DUF2141 domain-containing protein [Nitrosomonas cryotolerans]SFP34406.1 Uncharacterized conserved protein, DUF2141 family [Nitrosomonas cryotolerans]SIO34323.1 Uncharacterized conserved protein, DUF2141 family [Nitrosomonas cryotolerans ATCC 49181]
MIDIKLSLKIIFKRRAELLYFFIITLLTSTPVHAAKQLDIRSYEAADPCSVDTAQIRVTVNGIGSEGMLSVELYHDPDNFLNKKGRKRRIRIPAMEKQHTVCFSIEQQGTYAVAAYHDVDGNRRLNKRWNMMPKEPFGLSNNPQQRFGFPKFSEAAFTTDALGANIIINLQKP